MVIESDFYATEAGRAHFSDQLTSIRYCVQEVRDRHEPAHARHCSSAITPGPCGDVQLRRAYLTLELRVPRAAPPTTMLPLRHPEGPPPAQAGPHGDAARDRHVRAIAQKEGLGFDKAVETCKARMARYQVTPNMLVVPPALLLYLALGPDEKINAILHPPRLARTSPFAPDRPVQLRGGRQRLRDARLPRLRRLHLDAVRGLRRVRRDADAAALDAGRRVLPHEAARGLERQRRRGQAAGALHGHPHLRRGVRPPRAHHVRGGAQVRQRRRGLLRQLRQTAPTPQAWQDKIDAKSGGARSRSPGKPGAALKTPLSNPDLGDNCSLVELVAGRRLGAGRDRHRAAVHRAPDDVGGARRRRPRHGRDALRPGRCAPAPLWPLYALPQPSALSPVLSLALADMQISANTSVKTIEGHVRLPFPCPALPTAPVSQFSPPSANSTLVTQNPSSRSPRTST